MSFVEEFNNQDWVRVSSIRSAPLVFMSLSSLIVMSKRIRSRVLEAEMRFVGKASGLIDSMIRLVPQQSRKAREFAALSLVT